MTDFTGSDVALIITAAGTFITALASAVAAILSVYKINAASKKIDDVHVSTNGKMDELLASTGREQRALGVLEGRKAVRDEIKLESAKP